MRVRTDEETAGGTLSAPMLPAKVPSVSPLPPAAESLESVAVWASWPRPSPLPVFPEARGAGARSGGAALSGTLAPRALPFADMPEVMCCLQMASLAALLSIMGHGRHVQTGVPMTHLNPEKHYSCPVVIISGRTSALGREPLLTLPALAASARGSGHVSRATAMAAAIKMMAHEAARRAPSSGSIRASAEMGIVLPSPKVMLPSTRCARR